VKKKTALHLVPSLPKIATGAILPLLSLYGRRILTFITISKQNFIRL